MDLLVVCADSGLSMEASLERVSRELGPSYPSLTANIHLTNLEIRAGRPRTLLIIGSAWVVLTAAFEIGLGRMMGYSWERLGSDYNMLEGGLLPIGFVIMATSPLIAARLRGTWRGNHGAVTRCS